MGNLFEDSIHHSICECSSIEHTLRFMHNKESGEIYTEVFLWKHKFLKRLWVGIKYIFGYKCQYGHWDCTMMYHKETIKLRDYLDKCIKENKLYRENNEH